LLPSNYQLAIPFLLILILSANNVSLGQVSTAPAIIQVSAPPTFVCNLMDSRAAAVGVRGADGGISVLAGSKLWLLFGDTTGPPGGPPTNQSVVGSSSVIESQLPFDCSSYVWLTDSSGKQFYQPLFSARTTGSDESTVPTGGLTVNGEIYIYSMRVSHWGTDPSDPTHAHGVLFKQVQGYHYFTEVASWPTDQLFVGAQPVEGELPNGAHVLFVATSALYRRSPVYLAYVLPQDIENPASYHYLTGYDRDDSPLWASEMAEAKPVPGTENSWVGELSFVYDAPLQTYLLMFFDYRMQVATLDLYSSRTPYGPFHGPQRLYPCGTSPADRPRWMEKAWGGCYGGFMVPDTFGPDGHDLFFTLSLWNPYTTVVLKTQISSLSTMTTSKASAEPQVTSLNSITTVVAPSTTLGPMAQSQVTSLPSVTTGVALTSTPGPSFVIVGAAIILIVVAIAYFFFITKRKKPPRTSQTNLR